MNPLPATSNLPAQYKPRHAEDTPLFKLLQHHLETFLQEREGILDPVEGYLGPEVRTTLEKFLECGILRFGFARCRCDDCGHEHLTPLSCRFRGFCPSCHARRLAEWSYWMTDNLLPDVPYRQWVLSWPKRLRIYFRYDPDLFRAFSAIYYDVLAEWMQTLLGEPDARPAVVVCDQTFGSLLDYHPHFHAIASHGLFRRDGSFIPLPALKPEDFRALERLLASRLLTLLVRRGKLRPEDRKAMLSWPHLGFSLDASVGARQGDREGLRRLLCYIYRHPFRLEGITYDEEQETVRYQARKPHGLKLTDTQVFEALEFIAALSRHIPPPRKHQHRYYGALHPRWRKEMDLQTGPPEQLGASMSPEEGRASWATLIWRVYGVDPLECPKCRGRMRIISIIVHDPVVPKILEHLGKSTAFPAQWPARQKERGPPGSEDKVAPRPENQAHWFVDEAPSTEDYMTDGPGWEEPAFDYDSAART